MSSIAAMQANKKGSQLLPNNVLAWELWFILANMSITPVLSVARRVNAST
jgi:hypothetical protein